MLWRFIFNSRLGNLRVSEAVEIARRAGYRMMTWNDQVYVVPSTGLDLGQPLFSQDDIQVSNTGTLDGLMNFLKKEQETLCHRPEPI